MSKTSNYKHNVHFREEMDKATRRYEALNKEAITIVRKITQEEIDEYNRRMKPSCHRLGVTNT